MGYELAQVNISRLLAPLDSPRLAEFMAALDDVNAAGDRAPGFVWRLQTEDGNATSVRAFEWDTRNSHGVIVNLTVWTSVEALADFVFTGGHVQIMRRRREWFAKVAEAMTVLWWVPGGHRPSTREAEEALRHLREHGPTPTAFTFRHPFPAPDRAGEAANPGDDWLCPA